MGRSFTIEYCLRTIDCCFPYCSLEIFVGGQFLDGGSLTRGHPEMCRQIAKLWGWICFLVFENKNVPDGKRSA